MKYTDHVLNEDDPQSAQEPLQAHPRTAQTPKITTQRRGSTLQSQTASTTVIRPTREAIRRCVCS